MVQLVNLTYSLSNDNTDHEGCVLEHKPVTIDCGELVWAVAFGSKTAETKPHSTSLNWYHYKQLSDLVLATGLSGGRIRIWDVKTGEGQRHIVEGVIYLTGFPHLKETLKTP